MTPLQVRKSFLEIWTAYISLLTNDKNSHRYEETILIPILYTHGW